MTLPLPLILLSATVGVPDKMVLASMADAEAAGVSSSSLLQADNARADASIDTSVARRTRLAECFTVNTPVYKKLVVAGRGVALRILCVVMIQHNISGARAKALCDCVRCVYGSA